MDMITFDINPECRVDIDVMCTATDGADAGTECGALVGNCATGSDVRNISFMYMLENIG